jgi:hypothetical protein
MRCLLFLVLALFVACHWVSPFSASAVDGGPDTSASADHSTESLPSADQGAEASDVGPVPPLGGPYLACYSLDAIDEGQVFDISGEGRHATCAVPECPSPIAPGRVRDALSFDGVDDHLRLTYDEGFQDVADNGLTATAWVRRTANVSRSSDAHIAGIPYGSELNNSWELWIDESEEIICFTILEAGLGREKRSCASTTLLDDGQWHHVAGLWNGREIALYIDGVQRASASAGPMAFDGQSLLVGADRDDGRLTNHWEGAIDELCIYGRALSADEIDELSER